HEQRELDQRQRDQRGLHPSLLSPDAPSCSSSASTSAVRAFVISNKLTVQVFCATRPPIVRTSSTARRTSCTDRRRISSSAQTTSATTRPAPSAAHQAIVTPLERPTITAGCRSAP